MKEIKTAEEVLRGAMGDIRYRLNGVNANIELEEAMRAYAEQFIDSAYEEFQDEIEELRRYRTHPERLTLRYDEVLSRILKLKEHLK